MADVAQEWRDLALDQNQDVYEFRRGNYHLSMNPVGRFNEELSFVVWHVDGDTLEPFISGETALHRILINEEQYRDQQIAVSAIVRSIISGEAPVIRYEDETAVDHFG